MPGQAGAALVAEPPDGRLDRGDVPAVPVDQQQRGPVQAGVPAQLDQARGQRLGADGQRAGEGRVLAARADWQRGRQRHAGPPLARTPGHGYRDPRVGVERQVRAVLLQGADRHHEQLPQVLLDRRPLRVRQLERRCSRACHLLPLPSVPPAARRTDNEHVTGDNTVNEEQGW
jgi:hypothetical protein